MADHGPQITAARLYRRRSASGNDYFAGRRGACKIALLKSHEVAEDGGENWNLVLSEAPASKADSRSTARPNEPAPKPPRARLSAVTIASSLDCMSFL